VRGDGQVVTRQAEAARAASLEIEFADGRLAVAPGGRLAGRSRTEGGPDQGSLF